MIHVRINWPTVILILLALAIYLLRAHPSPRPQPKPKARRPFVIDRDRDGHHVAGDDYDAETERLDREAADRARTAYNDTEDEYADLKERMNARNDKRQFRSARRR
jgi:hypothetical protein